MATINHNEARQAYSAFALVPGYEGLKFSPLLKKTKSVSNPKYSDLWSGAKVLQTLSQQPLYWQSIQQIRDRLILCLRLVHLCRSFDLQNTWRTLSFQDDQLFILIQRKGQKLAQWEPILKINCKNICPSNLLLSYVSLTQAFRPPGTNLFRSVQKPY